MTVLPEGSTIKSFLVVFCLLLVRLRYTSCSDTILKEIDFQSDEPGAHYHIYSPYQKLQSSHHPRASLQQHQHQQQQLELQHNIPPKSVSLTSSRALIATPEHWIQSLTEFHQHLDHITVSTDPQLPSAVHRARRAYLDMLQGFVLGNIYGRAEKSMKLDGSLEYTEYNSTKRDMGEDMTYLGTTMVGVRRLQTLEQLIVNITDQQLPGDIVETGVWRGGASVYAMAVLRAYVFSVSLIKNRKEKGSQTNREITRASLFPKGESTAMKMSDISNRRVYLCDSFAGLPPGKKQLHAGDVGWNGLTYLSVSDGEVLQHIQEFNLLDPRLVIVKGFFNESMPALRSSVFKEDHRSIAILRLDGDMYESTMDVLYHLYEYVTVGGFVIVDDWDGFPAKDACLDFFQVHDIQPHIVPVDRWSVYFQKTKSVGVQYWRYEKKQFK